MEFANLFLLMTVCVSVSLAAGGSSWTYDPDMDNGPANWGGQCEGSANSPVNIVMKSTERKDRLDWELENWDKNYTWKVENKKYTVQFDVTNGNITTNLGGLPSKYKFLQFHFHWGSTDVKGSEHTVDSMSYPMELHFVHYNTEYDTIEEAINSNASDALAALGFFFEISEEDNDDLSDLVQGVNMTVTEQTTDDFQLESLESIVGDTIEKGYYRYNGGLTTPPCNEQVVWTVFKTPIKISTAQMAVFRSIESGAYSTGLYRPVVPLNSRVITDYSDDEGNDDGDPSSAPGSSSAVVTMAITLLLAFLI